MRGFLSGVSRVSYPVAPITKGKPAEGRTSARRAGSEHPEPPRNPEVPAIGLQGIQVDPRSTRTQHGHNGSAQSDVSTERYDFDFPIWNDDPRPFNGRFQ